MAARPATPPEQKPQDPAHALGAGLTFAAAVALFALGGLWLDGRLHTSPLFVLIGIMLGLVGGTIHLLRVVAPSALPFGRKGPGTGKGPGRGKGQDPEGT
jgi:F0F1-type ATP synthase assembly protein I